MRTDPPSTTGDLIMLMLQCQTFSWIPQNMRLWTLRRNSLVFIPQITISFQFVMSCLLCQKGGTVLNVLRMLFWVKRHTFLNSYKLSSFAACRRYGRGTPNLKCEPFTLLLTNLLVQTQYATFMFVIYHSLFWGKTACSWRWPWSWCGLDGMVSFCAHLMRNLCSYFVLLSQLKKNSTNAIALNHCHIWILWGQSHQKDKDARLIKKIWFLRSLLTDVRKCLPQWGDIAYYGCCCCCCDWRGNSFLHILYGNLDQTTFYAANVLVSEKTRKSLNGNPPFGLLLGESYVTPARHYCTMACGSVGQQE